MRHLSLFSLLLATSLVACKLDGTPMPIAPAGSPNASQATPPAPTFETSYQDGRIQLLEAGGVGTGAPAKTELTASSLVTVASRAEALLQDAPALRFAVSPAEAGSVGSAYALAGLAPAQAGREADFGLGFRSSFTASNTANLAAPRSPYRLNQATEPRAVGARESFWINTGDSTSGGDVQRTCELKRVGTNAYLYVDVAAKLTADQLDRLITAFDQQIFPKVTGAFGPVPKPGVDGEDRVFLVVSPAVDNFGKEEGLMGYFWSRDAIPGGGGAHSNQKEAVFMTDQLFKYPDLTSLGTLAHEFQHLVNFTNKTRATGNTEPEALWLDEGFAMMAMEIAGYGLPAGDAHIAKDLDGFEKTPQKYSLTSWSQNPNGFAYGQSYLFVRYLVDRFGQDVLKAIIQSPETSVAGVERVLRTHGETFPSVFRAWTIANGISDAPLSEGTPFRYKNLPLAGDYGGFTLKGFQPLPDAHAGEQSVSLLPWGSAYVHLSGNASQRWTIDLGRQTSGRALGGAWIE